MFAAQDRVSLDDLRNDVGIVVQPIRIFRQKSLYLVDVTMPMRALSDEIVAGRIRPRVES